MATKTSSSATKSSSAATKKTFLGGDPGLPGGTAAPKAPVATPAKPVSSAGSGASSGLKTISADLQKQALEKATDPATKQKLADAFSKAGYDTSFLTGTTPAAKDLSSAAASKSSSSISTGTTAKKAVSAELQKQYTDKLATADDKVKADITKKLETAGYDTSFLGGNATQDTSVVKGDINVPGTKPHIAPNGNKYELTPTADGKVTFISKVTGKPSAPMAEADAIAEINKNNQVGSAPAVVGKTVVTADNNKEYEVTQQSDGKYSFVSKDGTGQVKTFNSLDEAKAAIAANNPKLNPNEPTIKDFVKEYDTDKEKNQSEIQARNDEILSKIDEASAAGDQTYANKLSLLSEKMNSVMSTFGNIDKYVSDLQAKSANLFDQNAANQSAARASQMAEKGYLTSDQVAQVASYDVAGYRRDVEIQKATIDKEIAEKKIDLEQAKQKMISEVQSDTMATEDAKQAQINYITQQFTSAQANLDSKLTATQQYFDNQSASLQALQAQSNVNTETAIKADEAQNTVMQAQKKRAMTDDSSRTAYYISRVSNANIHQYMYQAIKYLQDKGTYMKTANLESQLSAIVAAANALYKKASS